METWFESLKTTPRKADHPGQQNGMGSTADRFGQLFLHEDKGYAMRDSLGRAILTG
jgi:hypothetical protein